MFFSPTIIAEYDTNGALSCLQGFNQRSHLLYVGKSGSVKEKR